MPKIGAGEGLGWRALLLFGSRSVVLGMAFIASVLVARGLGPTARGTYGLAVLIPVLVSQTVSLGLSGAAVYLTGQGRFPVRHIISSLFWIALVLGSLGAVAAALALVAWGRALISDLGPGLLALAMASVPFMLWADWLGHVLLGQERTAAFALLTLLQTAVLVSIQGAGYFWARGRLDIALLGWLMAQVTAALAALTMLRRDVRPGEGLHWAVVREAVRFGRAPYATNWLSFLSLRLDQFLVQAWIGSASLGYYGVAVSLTEALWQLPISVGAVLFARVAAGPMTGQGESNPTTRVCRLTFMAMFLLAVLVAGVAQPLVRVLFGARYQPALPALYALLPGTVALVFPNVIGGYLYGRGLPYYATIGTGLALLVTITCDILLIPRHGIVGAGLASSLAYVTYGGGMVILAQRLSGEPWHRFVVPGRSDWQWLRSVAAAYVGHDAARGSRNHARDVSASPRIDSSQAPESAPDGPSR